MPEALFIVAVFVIAVIIYVAMWLKSRDPALHKPHEEVERLRHHAVWLEERLARARREHWGEEMVATIAHELDETEASLLEMRVQARAVSVPRS